MGHLNCTGLKIECLDFVCCSDRGINVNNNDKHVDFETQFRDYVEQKLEPEMQSDINKAEKQGDESQLIERERKILKAR